MRNVESDADDKRRRGKWIRLRTWRVWGRKRERESRRVNLVVGFVCAFGALFQGGDC